LIRIGVVVPCRGDRSLLPSCLESLRPFSTCGDAIVVVDGDGDPWVETMAANHQVFYQSNADGRRGIAIAAGVQWLLSSQAVDMLLICHADMRLRADTRDVLTETVGHHARSAWGWLGHEIDDRGWKFRLLEWGNQLRATVLSLPYGDQAMFVGADLLAAAGGWPLQPRMEDLELSLRLRREKKAIRVHAPVRTSARHWISGVSRTTVRNWLSAAAYILRRRHPQEFH
jgi:glycosyltransferase involved in cell wall biosynthesis